MASIDVVTGNDILATEYNLLRAEVIAAATVGGVNAEDIITTIAAASGAAADVVTHAAVTANIHGLASGIDVLGAASPGLYIQYINVEATVHHTSGNNSETTYITASWPQAFSSIYCCTVSCGSAHSWSAGAGYLENVRNTQYTTSAINVAVRTFQSADAWGKIPLRVIGIGN